MRLITLFATITANGYIADIDDLDEIFDDPKNLNWNCFEELALEHGNIIWGRKTYEMVMSWSEEYTKNFEKIQIIVLSNTITASLNSNVVIVKNIEEALKITEELNLKPFVAGGKQTYSSFLEDTLVNRIILNFNSFFINQGIKLFNDDITNSYYKIKSVTQKNDSIAQIILER